MDGFEMKVHRVTSRPMTPEERARFEAFKAESNARDEVMVREAVAEVKCPTCKAEPGSECAWRVRHSERVHSPRLYRTPTWKADMRRRRDKS